MALVRIQLLVEEEDNEALAAEAAFRGVSRSECVRQMIRRTVNGPVDEEDSFLSFTFGVASEGPTHISTKHDTYIYGGEITL